MSFFETQVELDDHLQETITRFHESAKHFDKAAKKAIQRRNVLMAQAVREGATLTEVGSWVGLSRQGVASAIGNDPSLFDEDGAIDA